MATHLLPDNAAQQSIDCDFISGSLRGLASDDPVAGISGVGVRSMFVFEGGAGSGTTFLWGRDVDAVRSPVVNDAYARFYWSDGSGFYVSRGDIGGNSEPSTNNKYKVGVPRPVYALIPSNALMSLPGVTGYEIKLCDERMDGTFSNCTDIDASGMVFSPTSATLSFYSRPAATSTDSGTTATSTTQETVGTWYPKGYGNVGAENGPGIQIYGNQLNLPSTQYVAYYETPLSPPDAINVYSPPVTEGNWTFCTYFRLGNTFWYGVAGVTTPPTQSGPETPAKTTTTTESPISGSVIKLTMIRDTGNLTAIVRTDSNKTSWPTEIPGYSAYLTADDTHYTLTISASQDFIEHRAYTYTYVNQYGEESAPADPMELDCAENSIVSLAYDIPPTGYCPVTKVRIYRTATGVASSYLYVGESLVTPWDPRFIDDMKNEALGHTLDTYNYYPPDQGLLGICTMANGMLVGFKSNEIHFMEPYLPYACNPNAIKPLPHKIVGICPYEGGLYVTTTASSFIIQGAAPEYMTDMVVPSAPAGVSKWAIDEYNGSVVYASSDGLVMAQGLQADLGLSFKFYTREKWHEEFGARLSRMRLDVHDGSLLVWFTDGTPGFLIRFEEDALSLTYLSHGYYASYRHPIADALYVSNGSSVFNFRAGFARASMTWRSKDFILPKPTNFGSMQLIGSGTLTLTVYADGVSRYSAAVSINNTGTTVVRLPSGFLARRWSFSLSGSGEVREAYLSNAISELPNV